MFYYIFKLSVIGNAFGRTRNENDLSHSCSGRALGEERRRGGSRPRTITLPTTGGRKNSRGTRKPRLFASIAAVKKLTKLER